MSQTPRQSKPKVAVGSRAEAKQLRKTTQDAAKHGPRPANVQRQQVEWRRALEKRHAARARAGAVSWRPADALVALGMVLVVLIVRDVVLATRPVALMPEGGRVLARVAVLAISYSIQLAVLATLAARHSSSLTEAFCLRVRPWAWREFWMSSLFVALLLVATRAVSTAYGTAAQRLGYPPPEGLSLDVTAFGVGTVGLALAGLLVVLLAPFTEELIFRGVVLHAIAEGSGERLPRLAPWLAVTVSAALFATSHLALWTFVPTFVLGLALGWLAWTRRTLWPAIVLHALYNAVALGMGLWLGR